jgi:hypothetical protein
MSYWFSKLFGLVRRRSEIASYLAMTCYIKGSLKRNSPNPLLRRGLGEAMKYKDKTY